MRYIPHTDEDITRMLATVGVDGITDLFDTVPASLKLNRDLDLPPALSEEALVRLLTNLAGDNPASADRAAVFLGAGAYAHHVPATVDQLLLRGEFFTAYTPYQPEASQGTLQAIFEYQSMMAALTGCEVVNASMYDGATAAAEALLMALRIKRKRPRLLLSGAVHPEVRAVARTYLSDRDPEPEDVGYDDRGQTDRGQLERSFDDRVAAVLIQQPNALGCLEDLPGLADLAHAHGALLVTVVLEPVSLGLLEAPARLGSDVVVGEGMALGSGLNFGGPGLGIFGTSRQHTWQMPGRLVGETSDPQGRRGYVLTMATREQHIRRARATSNICTNEGLCALAAAIHLSLLGRDGFPRLARINAANAQAARERLERIPGITRAFSAPGFNEFALRLSKPVEPVLARLASEGIVGGFPLGRWYPELEDCLLTCVTERNTLEQVERLSRALEAS